MTIDRRTFLAAAALTVLADQAAAAADGPDAAIALWPGHPPDGNGPQGDEAVSARGAVRNVAQPRLIVYRPARPNGTAALVIAGGGYSHIERGGESTPAALWLRSLGVTAFELVYRLPEEGWTPKAPLQDGQRAMRLIRAQAESSGIDAARVGVIGFSAGGHLAGMTAAKPAQAFYAPIDGIDKGSARPDFAALLYPVLTVMPPFDHTHTRRALVGDNPSEAQRIAYSVERQVDAEMPRTFLAQAADDPIAPIENSLLMFAALRQAKVPVEMHVFQTGGHGWGMGSAASPPHAWPDLFKTWMAL